ncbi:MAG: hypothetical protein M3Y21_05690 [Candidatus Eremiobacteraeota bacterium]|nr:hypothetical protein [Candidatus Eremiobacteraeota bacterium]
MSVARDDLVLMPETVARRLLGARPLALSVLAPVGPWLGRGTLRVLRVRESLDGIELTVGYESYCRVDS